MLTGGRVLEPMTRVAYLALIGQARRPITQADLALLPDETRARCYAGAAWYAEHRNGPAQVPYRPWTSQRIRAARDRARFMTTVYTTYQLAVRDTDWLARELDEVRAELSATRMRAELGSELAAAWRRANEVTAQLAEQTRTATAEIPKQRTTSPAAPVETREAS